MGRRDNCVTTYLTDAEKAQIEEWAEKADKPVSQLLRDAILEYTDRDRVRRMEGKVEDLEEKIDRVLVEIDSEHTHTRSNSRDSRQQSVPETTREIADIIYTKHSLPVSVEDLEIVIENNAGGTARTVRQYKSQLKKRGLLYEHPAGNVWTDNKQTWVEWVEHTPGEASVIEVVDGYGMTTDEYDKIAERIQ
jgi:Ribbon-helix-helix protein, copG family.